MGVFALDLIKAAREIFVVLVAAQSSRAPECVDLILKEMELFQLFPLGGIDFLFEKLGGFCEEIVFVGMAAPAEEFQGVADLVDDVGLYAFGWFVQDEEVRLGEKRAADGQVLLLSAREHAALAMAEVFQDGTKGIHAFERGFWFFPLCHSADVEVLLHREMRKNTATLGDVSDASARAFLAGKTRDVLAFEEDFA